MIKSSVVTDRTRPERRMTAKVLSIVSSTSKRPCGTVCHSSECTGTTHLPTNEVRALRASKVLGASNAGLRGTFRVQARCVGRGFLNGVDRTDNFRRAAAYVDHILNGEKPSELPVTCGCLPNV